MMMSISRFSFIILAVIAVFQILQFADANLCICCGGDDDRPKSCAKRNPCQSVFDCDLSQGEHCYAQVPCTVADIDVKEPKDATKPVNPKKNDETKDPKDDAKKDTPKSGIPKKDQKDDTKKDVAKSSDTKKDEAKSSETKKDDATTKEKPALNKEEKKIIEEAKKIIAEEKKEIAAEKEEKEASKSSNSYAMAFSVLAVFVLAAILYFVCNRGSANKEPLRLYKAVPRNEPV